MTNVISFHEEATKQCNTIGAEIGEAMARNIMDDVILYGLSPDQMEAMVNASIDHVRKTFIGSGACEHDVEVICAVIYRALIKKGKEIAILSDWEGGCA